MKDKFVKWSPVHLFFLMAVSLLLLFFVWSAALEGKPVRFTQCCTPDGMSDMVLSGLGIAKE